MYLILCSQNDSSAMWAYDGLQRLGLGPITLLTPEMLAYSSLWEHRIGTNTTSLRFRLPSSQVVEDHQIRGVLNRLPAAPDNLIRHAGPKDQEYASQEMMAFYMSWLHALPGAVLNRPTPQGLCGTWRHTSEWIWLAHRAGLPAPRYVQSGRDAPQLGYQAAVPFGKRVHPVLVAAGRVFSEPLPASMAEGCRKLAELAKTEILGIDLFEDSDSLQFAGATPIPDLQQGGLPLLKHLAQAMQDRRIQ